MFNVSGVHIPFPAFILLYCHTITVNWIVVKILKIVLENFYFIEKSNFDLVLVEILCEKIIKLGRQQVALNWLLTTRRLKFEFRFERKS